MEKNYAVTRHTFDEVIVPTYAPSAFIPVRGAGLNLWDQQGKEYLDLTAGIAVTSLGHAHPVLVDTIKKQAETLWHVSNYYTNEPVLQLGKALTEATFADRAFFCNSGGEANEAALKLARRWAHDKYGLQKARIISFVNSFHGRTLFTVSVGGQPKYSEGFGPLPGMIEHIPYNDIDAAHAVMDDDVCAVIVEPVQGEGGVMPATTAFLQTLRELCDRHNALLIYDEIQSGMGRTGKLFAYMDYDVVPDIMTSAKALGNGFPIGAMLTTNEIAAAFTVGVHGTTYGGNPLAASVACEVMKIINTPDFLSRVVSAGEQLKKMLEGVVAAYPQVFGKVRGKGLMLGLVMSDACLGRAKEITAMAEKNGLLLLLAGLDVIRLVPPLIITDEHIRRADALLRQSVDEWIKTAG
ncbi:acetylornithine/succinyldiaminopimelate transaminase [Oxalobacter vibrioformis]|uniref:Acetylornithine aminotransferase n=1 Tax=Oxalobacter vibrioformis TaxID=933080 RepID=A0A9E9LYQ4_9BURK|nr:acetylornithine/succinyldiaminopimelate transaminase [Oxalobacter vibrioformis]WAW11192.1 acetylornithine/succinyldiaminopimelate transaminase [Oxalobacter vibrioformis]